jgi:hypothetical protein
MAEYAVSGPEFGQECHVHAEMLANGMQHLVDPGVNRGLDGGHEQFPQWIWTGGGHDAILDDGSPTG